MAAPWAYMDTSVLLKRYLDESGSAEARRLLRRYRVVSSAIAPVEATSALWQRRAVGDVAETDLQAILKRLAEDRSHWEFVDLTTDVLDRAEHVIRRTGVRTLDAVHLASVLTIHAANVQRRSAPFITGDARQRDAATGLGLQVTWVG
ncbi:MAG TPA: type II toxin-antitoxin system VapC family toxin [bacterium]|nr:type II toxin-antitoxin system VapC family toxin [bacterium]